MGKMLLRVFFSLLGISVCLFSLLVLTNIYDPPLKEEVENILAKQETVSDEQKAAFFFLLGLYVNDDIETAETRGSEIWARFEKGETDIFATAELKSPFPAVNFKGCGEHPVCTVEDLEADPLLAQQIVDNEIALKRLNRLMSYGHTANLLLNQDEYWAAPQFTMLPADQDLARLFHLQIAQLFKEGETSRALDLIENTNHYMQDVLVSGTELERTMASIYLRNNAQLLKLEKDRQPDTHLSENLLQSFSVPDSELVLRTMLETELKIFASSVMHFKQAGNINSLVGAADARAEWWHGLPAMAGLRMNETLNKFYEIQSQLYSSPCPHFIEENLSECAPALVWITKTPWFYIRNPIGHSLTNLNTSLTSKISSTLVSKLDEVRQLHASLIN